MSRPCAFQQRERESEGGRDTQTCTDVHVHNYTQTYRDVDVHTYVHTYTQTYTRTYTPPRTFHTHTHVRIRCLLLVHGLETHTSDVAGIAWLAEWVARHGFSSTILPAMLAHAQTRLDPALFFSHQTYRQGQRDTQGSRQGQTTVLYLCVSFHGNQGFDQIRQPSARMTLALDGALRASCSHAKTPNGFEDPLSFNTNITDREVNHTPPSQQEWQDSVARNSTRNSKMDRAQKTARKRVSNGTLFWDAP